MSTIVSLVLAAVFNFLGGELPKEVPDLNLIDTYKNEIKMCDEHSKQIASNCIIIKNEQIFKVKGIR